MDRTVRYVLYVLLFIVAIYTRTIRVKDDMLGKAMEIGKALAKVRKKYYPKHAIYFSFQIGGDPRTIRETLIGPMFEGDNEADAKMSERIRRAAVLGFGNVDTRSCGGAHCGLS